MAEALNQKGNEAYRSGNFEEARLFYSKASELDEKEPKYTSNLSAAFYEEGDYEQCVEYIARSWKKIQDHGDDQKTHESLSIKLSTRLAKAKLQLEFTPPFKSNLFDNSNVIESMQKFVEAKSASDANDTKLRDMVGAWDQWNHVRSKFSADSLQERQAKVSNSLYRFRAANIFKCTSDPTLEFYTFGHDQIYSLLDTPNERNKKLSIQLDLIHDKEEKKKALSFLFGGSGDCRHVFGTLIDIAQKVGKDVAQGKEVPDVHITLVDIHPATLARSLIVFELIHRISKSKEPDERFKLQTTLFYVYTSLIIPGYCNNIVVGVAKDLAFSPLNSGILPPWLYINPQSEHSITQALLYWSKPLKKSTKVLLECHGNLCSMGQGKGMIWPLTTNPAQTNEVYTDNSLEDTVFDIFTLLLPPMTLLHLHPSLAQYVAAHGSATRAEINSAKDEILRDWKPNPLLFDIKSTEHPMFGRVTGYPSVTAAPHDTLFTMLLFNMRVDPKMPLPFGKAGVSVVTLFFQNVVKALQTLENHVKIEVVHADVISGLPKLVAGDLGKRPDEFPSIFTRIWLSNVPDYTNGILNNVIYILPHHPSASNTAMAPLTLSNCLWNTSAFRSVEDFCFNYTLLCPSDLKKYLGCVLSVPDGSLFRSKISLAPLSLPRPFAELASKSELYRWLSHLLLCTLCSGRPLPPPRRVDLPNNLTAFFHLLIHLRKVGYPAHWIGEYVQMLVSNTLTTEMKPYLGEMPIPVSAGRSRDSVSQKVDLKPWQMDLEVIVATLGPSSPFFFKLPEEYRPFDDIRTYSAKVTPIALHRHPSSYRWAPLASPFVMTTGLIFYESKNGIDAEFIAQNIPAILDGTMRNVQMQISIGADRVDLSEGVVQWRMSRKWYDKMKTENWRMAVYRTDILVAACEPTAAISWTQVQV